MFTFAPQHTLQVCNPAPGLIEGSFNPGVNGPGSYSLAFSVAVTNDVIASGTVQSPDGAVVAVSLSHSATNGGTAGAFQRNLRVAINGAAPGPPQPVCLAAA